MYSRKEIVQMIDEQGVYEVVRSVASFEVDDLELRKYFDEAEDAMQELLDYVEPEMED